MAANSNNEFECDFSIIIPVYNTADYLDECMKSIMEQTFEKYEVILVDDGSTDGSDKICDKYATIYENVKAFHINNSGQLHARLFGASKATGSYYIYVDSDDTIERKALSYLYRCFKENDCDCIIYGFRRVLSNECLAEYTEEKDSLVLEKKDIYKKCLLTQSYNSMCRKAIRASVANTGDYSEFFCQRLGEDLLQSIEILKNCESVFFSKEILYNYRVNPKSVTELSQKKPKLEADFTVQRIVLDFILKENVLSETELEQYRVVKIQQALLPIVIDISKSSNTIREKKRLLKKIRKESYYIEFLCKGKILNIKSCAERLIYWLFIQRMDYVAIIIISTYFKCISREII